MPDLDSKLHVDMLRGHKRANGISQRIDRAAKALWRELFNKPIYGLEWGDPDAVEPLRYVREHFVTPFIDPKHTALEIGPGGGRWTRFLLPFKTLYLVDYYQELLDEIRSRVAGPNLVFIKNNGCDLPGLQPGSIDFVFSFGVFVHLDLHLIEGYLKSLREVTRTGSNLVIQYADKQKIMAKKNHTFSDNTPERMRQMVASAGFKILEEDLTTLWHSSIVRFTPAAT